MNPMILCRAGDYRVLLPTTGLVRLWPWFETPVDGEGKVQWEERRIPLVPVGEHLGMGPAGPELSSAVAVFDIVGELLALKLDRMEGLLTPDFENAFTVPRKWTLHHPELPYRRFFPVEESIVPEISPLHLLVGSEGERSWPMAGDVSNAPGDVSGRFLSVVAAGVPLAFAMEEVERVLEGETVWRFPALPITIHGMLLDLGQPIPVVVPFPSPGPIHAVVVLHHEGQRFGVAVERTLGILHLQPGPAPGSVEIPPLLGGATVMENEDRTNRYFVLSSSRIGSAMGR